MTSEIPEPISSFQFFSSLTLLAHLVICLLKIASPAFPGAIPLQNGNRMEVNEEMEARGTYR